MSPARQVMVPLYQAKAEFFRMLGHPVRIRVLELLQDGPKPVRELLADIGIERSSLSQQLAVLRRSGIVTAVRESDTVVYSLAGPDVAELLRAARRILTELLAGQQDLLADLREADAADGTDDTGPGPDPAADPGAAPAPAVAAADGDSGQAGGYRPVQARPAAPADRPE